MSDRIRKINELIREGTSTAIAENVKTNSLITVTAVETSPDLKHSTIWVSILGDEKEAMTALEEKRIDIQHEVTGKMATKYTPRIHFRVDHSQEHVQRIEELLRDDDAK